MTALDGRRRGTAVAARSAVLSIGWCLRLMHQLHFVLPSTMAQSPFLSYDLPPESSFLKVDQFGYLPGSLFKVAVISNPQVGFNSLDSFTPSTDDQEFEVREWTTNQVAFSGPLQVWQNGETAPLSGDSGWWFDFSALTTPGTYFVYDPIQQVRSYEFEISQHVYDPILRAAGRMFYYQRSGIPKVEPYAELNWTYDGAAFARQESVARYYLTPDDATSERDLSGGWFDAGDFNKYVTFAYTAVHNLLWSYRENPDVFKAQEWNLPSSDSSGLPDVLKEVQSRRIRKQIYYSGTCSSASISVAGIFAHAAVVFEEFDDEYAQVLRDRAEKAWANVASALASGNLETECDDGTIKSGDADWTVELQRERAITSAVYLVEATGNALYNDYITTNIKNDGGPPITDAYWDFYNMEINDALLLYATLPEASGDAIDAISISIQDALSNNWNDIYGFDANKDDLYRGSLHEYFWGSNQQVASMGILNLLMIKYGTAKAAGKDEKLFEAKAIAMLHYLHGVNPLGMVHLTNMYALGGDYCANEIYHGWFLDGTIYDSVLDPNNVGPPPGYLSGGCNQDFTGSLSPPQGQPPQKAYLDFNTGSPDSSWEVSEPAIYYQSAYVRLLANFASPTSTGSSTCLVAGTSCLRGIQDGNCNCVPKHENSLDDENCDTANDMKDGACFVVDQDTVSGDALAEWSFWGCSATSIGGEAHLSGIQAGNTWEAGFGRHDLTLRQGQTYMLTFTARASSERSIDVKVGLPIDPFTSFVYETLQLGEKLRNFEFSFLLTGATITGIGLDFHLGAEASEVVLSSAALAVDNCQSVTPAPSLKLNCRTSSPTNVQLILDLPNDTAAGIAGERQESLNNAGVASTNSQRQRVAMSILLSFSFASLVFES